MRALYATGWMHQSVRMVCASFLVEFLHIDWREGARWFHETLVDADLAINSMMWQVGETIRDKNADGVMLVAVSNFGWP